MQEVCSDCGRRGDLKDRNPVWSNRAETQALRCPKARPPAGHRAMSATVRAHPSAMGRRLRKTTIATLWSP